MYVFMCPWFEDLISTAVCINSVDSKKKINKDILQIC